MFFYAKIIKKTSGKMSDVFFTYRNYCYFFSGKASVSLPFIMSKATGDAINTEE